MSPTNAVTVRSMGSSGGRRRPYPDGAKVQMSAAWKVQVDAALAARGWTRAELARRIGADRSAITRMMQPDQQTSALVEPICEVLGLSPPLVDLDPEEVDTLDDYRQLTAADRQVVKALIAALRKSKQAT